MKVPITINVTQKDIERGTVGNPYYCPIALACRRVKAFGPGVTASVNSYCITFYQIDLKKVAKALNGKKGQVGWPCSTTSDAYKFMSGFDRKKRVIPGTFTVYYEA